MKFNRLHKVLCLLIGLILPLLSFGNDETSALFTKGNACYAKAQYKDAFDTYEHIIDEGYESAAVYFNMGNASYKNGDVPSALLYYGKAHKLAPGDDDINFNIRFANSKTTDKIDEVPEFFLVSWWKAFILSFSTTTLSVLSVIFMLCGSIVLTIYFFAGLVAIKKFTFYAAIVLFLAGMFSLFVANRQVNYFDGHRQAIVFSNSVTVRSGPAERSATLFVIHDGTKVNILDSSNGWMKIRLANGNEGWLTTGSVKEI